MQLSSTLCHTPFVTNTYHQGLSEWGGGGGQIWKINGKCAPGPRISLTGPAYHYHLKEQHRVGDADYLSFLNTIRKWAPSQQLLDQIQDCNVISKSDTVTDDDFLHAYHSNPDNKVLTFTKKIIIIIIIKAIFNERQPLAHAQQDCA
jgi:hypothetical protein